MQCRLWEDKMVGSVAEYHKRNEIKDANAKQLEKSHMSFLIFYKCARTLISTLKVLFPLKLRLDRRGIGYNSKQTR